jgi:hypothetical protein
MAAISLRFWIANSEFTFSSEWISVIPIAHFCKLSSSVIISAPTNPLDLQLAAQIGRLLCHNYLREAAVHEGQVLARYE